MPGWICPACNTENRFLDSQCKACGQSRASAWGASASRTVSRSSLDSLRGESRSILDDVKIDLSRSAGAISRVSDQPTSAVSEAPILTMADRQTVDLDELVENETEFPDLISSAQVSPANLPKYSGRNVEQLMRHVGAPAFQRVTDRELKIKINSLPRLNYSMVHCGFPLISSLQIKNDSKRPIKDVILKAWLAPDYSEPWQKSVPDILPGKKHVEKNLHLPLVQSRLQRVHEAEEGCLRIDVLAEGQLYFSDTYPIEVLAYNEWYFHPDHAETMACFVRPNSGAIEKIINLVRDRLRREDRDTSLSGYQEGKPEKVLEMLEALYNTLQQDLKITYINPPPSFENGTARWGGIPSISQKVFFAEEIYENRRGTCLDLALLCAACLERMGLHPMCFLMRGHAYFGSWMDLNAYIKSAVLHLGRPVWKKHAKVMKLIEAERLQPLNSTTFAVSPPRPFLDCRLEGMHVIQNPKVFWCGVDVILAHRGSAKPLP